MASAGRSLIVAICALFLPQSLSYHGLMQRFVALIAVIFAFASLAGMTTAHAHRYVSTPIVVLNHVDENNKSIPVVVQVQRGEIDLGSGILMPFGPHHGIVASAPQIPAAPALDRPDIAANAAPGASPPHIPLRPPRAA